MNIKSKKVMFITGGLTDGGAEKVMSILASEAAELGADVKLVILREKPITYKVSDKVTCIQMRDDGGKFKIIHRVRTLRKIVKESNSDTLIPFLPIVSLYTLVATVGLNKRIILSERADPKTKVFAKNLNAKDIIGNFITRKLGMYNLADWMVFQTNEAKLYFNKRLQKKSSVIPNPLDVDNLPNYYDGQRKKTIVAVGRFSHEKNFPMLIKAFSIFVKNYPDYNMIIYGEGKLRNEYENLIRTLNVEKFISMPGYIKNIPENIVNKAMYISTSNHEGISNSMLEALGVGVPTIVTDCPIGGARMFVKNNENGILIPMEDVDALVEAMNKIAKDVDFAKKISINALNIRNEINAEEICKKWLELV